MKILDFLYRLTHWETWPYLVKYIPLAPAWLWYCLRSRSLWFFTPSNPTLTFGGFEGESKNEMYLQLPEGSYPRSICISHSLEVEEAIALFNEGHFSFPFAVKPDVGMMGFMFRKIENIGQFKKYHTAMDVDYLLQEFVNYPLEVSVFYYRYPHEQTGSITGFIKKEFLEVKGNGVFTLLKLMQEYPRVRFRLDEMKLKHDRRLNDIIPDGEIFVLSNALNLSRGGKLVSLAHEKDSRLLKIFDALSLHTKHFYYGRYDIKCSSVEDLKHGRNFSILEFNGCGAEPHHIYGNGHTLLQAYRIVLQHWKVLYKISRQNYLNGNKYWSHRKGITFLAEGKQHFKKLRKLDTTFEI